MAATWYNDGGTWRQATALWYNDAGTWRQAQQLWYNDAGTWRKVFSAAVGGGGGGGALVSPFTAWNVYADANPGTTKAVLNFNSNGTVTYSVTGTDGTTPGSDHWFSPTTVAVGAGYWLRATVTSGTLTANSAASWTSLATNLSFEKGPSSGGAASATVTFEIATDSGGSNIVWFSTGNVLRYTHAGI